MNTTKYHDENADSLTKIVHPCVSRSVPSKSPLKTLNDARRLASSPRGIQDTEDVKTPQTSPYTYIRQLDSAEKWIERTSVVTKQDHLSNVHNAQSILEDLISSLPISTDNVWIQESSDTSGVKGTTQSPGCPASEHCFDIDSLSDMLFDLNIVGENKSFTDDPAAYKSYLSTQVEEVLRDDVCDKGFGLIIKNSSDASPECSGNAYRVTCTKDCQKLDEKMHTVSADDSANQMLSVDVQQILKNEGNESFSTSVAEKCQPEIADCVKENEHCISEKNASNDTNTDPFKTKLLDSPVCEQQAPVNEEVKGPILDTDPFKPKLQLVNSPVCEQQAPVNEEVKDPILDTDPFKPKLQLVNSPVCEQQAPVNEEVKDPILDTDPFKPKLQLVNSPVSEQQAPVNEEVKDPILDTDPFKPKLQLVNSPVSEQQAPVNEEVKDPILDTDPFKPKLQLVNSPVSEQQAPVNEEVKDPILDTDLFKPKLQLVNSPVSEQQAPVNEEVKDPILDTDPFKPKLQLVNSPVSEQQAPVNEEVKNPRLDEKLKDHILDEEVKNPILDQKIKDPILDKEVKDPILDEEVKNPILDEEVKNPVLDEEVKDTILDKEVKNPILDKKMKDPILDTDPFKPKLQLVNSPVCEQQAPVNEEVKDPILDTDPFKPKLQLVNSPVSEQQAPVNEEVKNPRLDEKVKNPRLDEKVKNPRLDKEVKNPILDKKMKDPILDREVKDPIFDDEVKNPILDKKMKDPILDKKMKDPISDKKMKEPILDKKMMKDPILDKKMKDPILDKEMMKDPILDKEMMKDPILDKKMMKDPILDTDPFKPKLQLVNSPICEQQAPVNEEVKNPILDTDPFKPKLQLVNSPVREQAPVNEEVKDPILDTDPFKPKLQLVNSPVCEQHATVGGNVYTELKIELMNQAAMKNEIKDCGSGVRLPEPTVGNIQLLMPASTTMSDQKMVDLYSTINTTDDDVLDALKRSAGLESAHYVIEGTLKLSDDTSEADHTEKPSDPKKDINNVVDVHNSESNTDQESQLVAGLNISQIDPFQSTKQLVNSPILSNKINNLSSVSTPLYKVSSNTVGLIEKEVENAEEKAIDDIPQENLDNFVPAKEAINPKSRLTDTISSDNKTTPEASFGQEIVTSVSTTKVVNGTNYQANMLDGSINKDAERYTSGTQSGSDDLCGSAHPDQLKSLANSPVVTTDERTVGFQVSTLCEDPFRSNSQLENSPLKSSEQTAGCGITNTDIVDAVSTNSTLKLMNSPAASATSITPKDECHLSAKNVPTLEISETCNKTTGKVSSNQNNVTGLDVSTSKQRSVMASCGSEHSVPLNVDDGMEEEFLESEFIPATQAFNDPSFLDMLEKSNNTCTLNTKRGSVLMKFDPLQEQRDQAFVRPASPGPLRKPSRISDAFNLSKTSGCSDESVCLFGTPPRVARRRTLTRKVHSTRGHIIEEEAAAQVDMFFGSEDDEDGMDTILHDNLMPLTVAGARLVDIEESATYTESAVKQIRAKLTMHYQELLLKKDKEYQEKAKQQEEIGAQDCAQRKAESDTLKSKIKSLEGKLNDLSGVLKEYENLVTEVSADKKKVVAENEKLTVQVTEVEASISQVRVDYKELDKSFGDLLHRYDKMRGVVENFIQNEKVYKQALQEANAKSKSCTEVAHKIKQAAEAKITELEEKCEKMSVSSKDDIVRLEATVKRKEIQINKLETSLEQKTKENKELTELCDQLINKGSHPKTSS